MVVFFLINLPFYFQGGFWYFNLFNEYSIGLNTLIILLLEVIIIGRMFGIDELEQLLKMRTCETFPRVLKFMIRWVTPIIISVFVMLGVWSEFFKNDIRDFEANPYRW